MKARSQIVLWASILLALTMILLDNLQNSPTVTNHREHLAQSDQPDIEFASILSETNQLGNFQKLQQELPRHVESERPESHVAGTTTATSMHVYVVQKNDTLGEIAQRYKLDIDSLLHANKLQNADKIRYGQKLRIPLQRDISHAVKEN